MFYKWKNYFLNFVEHFENRNFMNECINDFLLDENLNSYGHSREVYNSYTETIVPSQDSQFIFLIMFFIIIMFFLIATYIFLVIKKYKNVMNTKVRVYKTKMQGNKSVVVFRPQQVYSPGYMDGPNLPNPNDTFFQIVWKVIKQTKQDILDFVFENKVLVFGVFVIFIVATGTYFFILDSIDYSFVKKIVQLKQNSKYNDIFSSLEYDLYKSNKIRKNLLFSNSFCEMRMKAFKSFRLDEYKKQNYNLNLKEFLAKEFSFYYLLTNKSVNCLDSQSFFLDSNNEHFETSKNFKSLNSRIFKIVKNDFSFFYKDKLLLKNPNQVFDLIKQRINEVNQEKIGAYNNNESYAKYYVLNDQLIVSNIYLSLKFDYFIMNKIYDPSLSLDDRVKIFSDFLKFLKDFNTLQTALIKEMGNTVINFAGEEIKLCELEFFKKRTMDVRKTFVSVENIFSGLNKKIKKISLFYSNEYNDLKLIKLNSRTYNYIMKNKQINLQRLYSPNRILYDDKTMFIDQIQLNENFLNEIKRCIFELKDLSVSLNLEFSNKKIPWSLYDDDTKFDKNQINKVVHTFGKAPKLYSLCYTDSFLKNYLEILGKNYRVTIQNDCLNCVNVVDESLFINNKLNSGIILNNVINSYESDRNILIEYLKKNFRETAHLDDHLNLVKNKKFLKETNIISYFIETLNISSTKDRMCFKQSSTNYKEKWSLLSPSQKRNYQQFKNIFNFQNTPVDEFNLKLNLVNIFFLAEVEEAKVLLKYTNLSLEDKRLLLSTLDILFNHVREFNHELFLDHKDYFLNFAELNLKKYVTYLKKELELVNNDNSLPELQKTNKLNYLNLKIKICNDPSLIKLTVPKKLIDTLNEDFKEYFIRLEDFIYKDWKKRFDLNEAWEHCLADLNPVLIKKLSTSPYFIMFHSNKYAGVIDDSAAAEITQNQLLLRDLCFLKAEIQKMQMYSFTYQIYNEFSVIEAIHSIYENNRMK